MQLGLLLRVANCKALCCVMIRRCSSAILEAVSAFAAAMQKVFISFRLVPAILVSMWHTKCCKHILSSWSYLLHSNWKLEVEFDARKLNFSKQLKDHLLKEIKVPLQATAQFGGSHSYLDSHAVEKTSKYVELCI